MKNLTKLVFKCNKCHRIYELPGLCKKCEISLVAIAANDVFSLPGAKI